MKKLRIRVPDTVPDSKRPGFAREMGRQLALVEGSAEDEETLAFIEHAADWRG